MLKPFDWLRLCRNGAELLATVRALERLAQHAQGEHPLSPIAPASSWELATPHTALSGPCLRCWVYAPTAAVQGVYCPFCQNVLAAAHFLDEKAQQTVLIWGYVNRLPQQLATGSYRTDKRVAGAFCRDDQHFLAALYRRTLQSWLQDLLLYDGWELRGVLSIFPAQGGAGNRLGELLCQVVYQERRFSHDQLRMRFLPTAQHVLQTRKFEKEGVVTFDAVEFMGLLESASVFRALMLPEEQETLREVLALTDPNEAQFYWGRFLGMITPEAKDMLTAWRVRQWSPAQRKLFFDLVDYVAIYRAP